MSEHPRDVQGEGDEQARQYLHLAETGNGPTHPNEEAILRGCFGDPDENGAYGGAQ